MFLTRSGNLLPLVVQAEQTSPQFDKVFSRVSLTRNVFDEPDTLIPLRLGFRLLRETAQFLDDPVAGATLGAKYSLNDLGLFGDQLADQAVLQSAINLAMSMVNSEVQSGTELRLHSHADHAIWTYSTLVWEAVGSEQDGLLSIWPLIATVRKFTSERWLPDAVLAPSTLEPFRTRIERAYGCDAFFRDNRYGIIFQDSVLSNLNSASGRPRLDDAKQPRKVIPDPADLKSVVAALVRLELTNGRPTLHTVADRMGLTTRTLQRKLTGTTSSFRNIYTHTIAERAIELLLVSKLSVTQVSDELGFADVSQFSRAFKVSTGI